MVNGEQIPMEHEHKWKPVHAGVRQNNWEIVWVCEDIECPGGQVKVTESHDA